MIPYIVLCFFLIWGVYLELSSDGTLRAPKFILKPYIYKIQIILPVLFIFLLGVLREETVGHDARNYYFDYWFKRRRYSWLELATNFKMDNGFFVLLKTIGLFTKDYWAARAVLFVITFGLYWTVIRKESPYLTLSIIVFLGLAHMGLMYGILRQALAGGICFFAYTQIKKGSWIKCACLVLLGATIHKSAIICMAMLPAYFLIKNTKIKKFNLIQLLILSMFAGVAAFWGIPMIVALYSGGHYTGIAEPDGGYGMLLFIIVILSLLSILMKETDSSNDNELALLYNLSCGALLLQVTALQWALLNRLTAYFSIYWCLLIPKLVCKLPKKMKMLFAVVFVLIFSFMFFYQMSSIDIFVMHRF